MLQVMQLVLTNQSAIFQSFPTMLKFAHDPGSRILFYSLLDFEQAIYLQLKWPIPINFVSHTLSCKG